MNRFWMTVAIGALAAGTGTALLAAEGAGTLRLLYRETSLGEVDPEADADTIVVSADRKHVAYVAKRAGRECVVLDGKVGKQYGMIAPGSVVFSPDGTRLAYEVQEGRTHLRVLEGKEGPAFDAVQGLVFSPDGAHTAYKGGRRGAGWRVVVDGKEGEPFEAISEIVYSADGKRLAYAGYRREVKTSKRSPFDISVNAGDRRIGDLNPARTRVSPGRWRPVIDGKAGKAFDVVGAPVFSPDGRRVAYVAGRAGQQFIVVDGKEGSPFDLASASPVFSPDSRRMAYVAGKGPEAAALVRGELGQPAEPAIQAGKGGQFMVVVDGVEGPTFNRGVSDDSLRFSSDSRRLSYVGIRDDKQFVVIDGQEKGYDGVVSLPVFSADGRRVAYGARRGGEAFVVLDGVEGKPYVGVGAEGMQFSPDGRKLAFTARRADGWVTVLDGVESRPREGIVGLWFTPDSRHLVSIASQGERGTIVVDGTEGRSFEGFPKGIGPAFSGPRTFRLIAERDRELFSVEVEIVED